MATHLGKEGMVRVGASPSTVAEVREWQLDTTSATSENTTINSAQANGGWSTHKATIKSWEGSVSCFWDETDTTGQETLDAGSEVELKLYPEGNAAGAAFFSGTAIVSAVTRKAAVDGFVEASFSFKGTGALTQATAP